MIDNRPQVLEDIDHYRFVPEGSISIDYSAMHQLLMMDLLELFSLLPIENELSRIAGHIIPHQPTEEIVQYFEKKRAKFQMLMIVVNLYDIRNNGEYSTGKPFSISLVPASKRGKPQYIDPAFFRNFDVVSLESQNQVYLGFNPFQQGYDLFGSINDLYEPAQNYYSDMIGYVTGIYFLANTFDFNEVQLNELVTGNEFISSKYKKLRIRKYFKEFTTIAPRKVWGADSPIELFLIHHLASKGVYPEIQSMIFEDGSVHPSIHHMICENNRESEIRMITEADLFFRDNKIAIFCDSTAHHRSRKAQEKDKKISDHLNSFGIKSVRINGSEIVNNLDDCTNQILEAIEN
jgi:hypothetical protein